METKEHDPNSEDAQPWFRAQDLPFVIAFTPFALLFGFHVAALAMLVRKWLHVPYILTMIVLYVALTIPHWLGAPHGLMPPTCATTAVLLGLIIPISFHGHDELMDGLSIEHSAPAHLILCMTYMVLPAVYTAMDARAA